MKRHIVLIVHNVRSCNNVGSLLRLADGLGISKVYLTGYTPYPKSNNDSRLPYISERIDKKIKKTALGAELSVNWESKEDITILLNELAKEKYEITALEQSDDSIKISQYKPGARIALIVGREVEGIEPEILKRVNKVLEIPMLGQKESFNVVQAATMALFELRYH